MSAKSTLKSPTPGSNFVFRGPGPAHCARRVSCCCYQPTRGWRKHGAAGAYSASPGCRCCCGRRSAWCAPGHVLRLARNRVAQCLAVDRPDLVRSVILLAGVGLIAPTPEVVRALQAWFGVVDTTEADRAEATKALVADPAAAEEVFRQVKRWPSAAAAQRAANRATPQNDWMEPPHDVAFLSARSIEGACPGGRVPQPRPTLCRQAGHAEAAKRRRDGLGAPEPGFAGGGLGLAGVCYDPGTHDTGRRRGRIAPGGGLQCPGVVAPLWRALGQPHCARHRDLPPLAGPGPCHRRAHQVAGCPSRAPAGDRGS